MAELLSCWALPRSLLLRCFGVRRNANLTGGFAGRFWFCWFWLFLVWFYVDLPFHWPNVSLYKTAFHCLRNCKDRAQCDIGHTGEKKILQGRPPPCLQKVCWFQIFTLPKVAPLHPGFSLSIFRRKTTEIDRALILFKVVRLEPYPPQFLKFRHVPLHPSRQWLRKIDNDSSVLHETKL